MSYTLKELYFDLRNSLKEHSVQAPDITARELIKNTIDVADIDMIIRSEKVVAKSTQQKINSYMERHIKGEPTSRIFGEREFWGLPFKITPDVLDPRADTETIIEAAIRAFVGDPPLSVLDLGTGSGCIIISLLTEWQRTKGVGVDVSAKALEVASLNAQMHKVDNRLTLVESNWCENLNGKYDLIVSNPPYISNQEITNLPTNVKNYDPILALEGGEDGLSCYRSILTEIKNLLNPHGKVFLEVGYSQAEDVSRLVEESGLFVIGTHADIAGIPRVVEISFGEK